MLVKGASRGVLRGRILVFLSSPAGGLLFRVAGYVAGIIVAARCEWAAFACSKISVVCIETAGG